MLEWNVQNMVPIRPSTKVKQLWHLWAKALGEKAGNTDAEADRIASIRTAIVLIYIITNFFIIAGVVRHW